MRFWRLTDPDYDSDYRNTYINGLLEHPFGLPGVDCDVCGQTWGGSRILPLECPFTLRKKKHIRERWPIPLAQHKELQSEIIAEFLKAGVEKLPQLSPGDTFQPCFLEVPSRPTFDFLWSSLGSVVVSDRVKEFLERRRVKEVAFCPVRLRKIGERRQPNATHAIDRRTRRHDRRS